MAKRPRMGRNLDALLGGSTRERKGRQSSAAQAAATERADDSGDTITEQADQTGSANDGAATDRTLTDPQADAADFALTPPATAPKEETAAEATVTPVAEPAESEAVDNSAAAAETASQAAVAKSNHDAARAVAEEVIAGTDDRFRMVGVDQIRRGSYQPRRLFDKELLQELADSIKAEGLIQPIIVRPFAGAYELVAGERRWRAAQLAGMAEIPAIIRDMPDKSVAAVSVIENIQRKDLNPLEEAAAFERLCDEFGMTHKAVAESVGRSRASVTNLMRLLELHDEVKVLVDKGELEMGHARAILGAPKDRQHGLAKDVIKRGLTVRAVEKLVREMTEEGDKAQARKSATMADPDIERLSKKLGETLGATVRIQHKSSGRGKLEINYASVSELQGILAHIK
ncbi:ParB/RepB/Spo0J family partition protein [Granulosicoccus sp. 3-233]|uniref:ParB/RepB/Spo0J family partition protein n=1 Tax=Granulosicoccus sp. 3-233 TaxID=3417969 RepID=UPI003D357B65